MQPHPFPALPAALLPQPEMVALPHAPAVFGISRRELYRLAADGRIVFRKNGRSTLVDAASVRAFLASLPTATLRSRSA